MAQAPPKPLHKPSESHTLDEVMKSLQDLIRNELVEPQAGQKPDIAKRSVAPPKIAPTVKPASRWEARGLGKAARKPAQDVDVDAVLDSLRDIVSQELATHTPRRPSTTESPPTPDAATELDRAGLDTSDLQIEWTEGLDAAAAALAPESESVSADDVLEPLTVELDSASKVSHAEEIEASPIDEDPKPSTKKDGKSAKDKPPQSLPDVQPGKPETEISATTSEVNRSGQQQTFLFDKSDGASPPDGLPTLDATLDISLDLPDLPETVELDDLTHNRSSTPTTVSPVPTTPEPTPGKLTTSEDKSTPRSPTIKDVARKGAVTPSDNTAAPSTEASTIEPVTEKTEIAPPSSTDETTSSMDVAPTPRVADDFNAVTPVNVGAIPSIDFVPSGASLSKKKPDTDSSAKSPEASTAPEVSASTLSAGETKAPTDQKSKTVDALIPGAKAEPETASPSSAASVDIPGAAVANATPAPPPKDRPVREIAVRTIAKLNIELRRCGERTLDPRMVDRLQFVLQELLSNDGQKKHN